MPSDWLIDVVRLLGSAGLGGLLAGGLTRRSQRSENRAAALRAVYEDYIAASDQLLTALEGLVDLAIAIKGVRSETDALSAVSRHIDRMDRELPDDAPREEVEAHREVVNQLINRSEAASATYDNLSKLLDASQTSARSALEVLKRKSVSLALIEKDSKRLKLVGATLKAPTFAILITDTDRFKRELEAIRDSHAQLVGGLAGAFA